MIVTLQRKCMRPAFSCYRSMHDYLNIKECNGIREITLNHPKTKNSLSMDMMSHLVDAIKQNVDDISLRAVVLSATGNIFSAGHNLKEFNTPDVNRHRQIFNKASELMTTIIQCPVPVIAKVNGFATAAGCQLVASCDIIVCSEISKFSTPGANFGIFCSTPGIALARTIPKSKAVYMLFTGDVVTAKEAYESGLVTKVVPESELDNTVNTIIDKIKLKSRHIVALGKEFYYKQVDLSLPEAYKLGGEVMVQSVSSPDGQEGVKSFIEKRKPVWNNK